MVRKAWISALVAALLSAPTAAWAQEGFGTPEEAEEPPPPEVPVEDSPRAPPPRAQPVVVASVAPSARASVRPQGNSVGIGVGYDFPAGLDRPDIASVRFRLASGLTFEPLLRLITIGTTTEVQQQGPNVDDSNAAFEFTLGANVRLPLKSRGPLDFILVGGASLGFASEDPDGDDNNSAAFAINLNWGLSIEWWLSESWVFGFTATNPLVSYNSQSQEMGPDVTQDSSTTSLGLVFDPNVTFMLHLFF